MEETRVFHDNEHYFIKKIRHLKNLIFALSNKTIYMVQDFIYENEFLKSKEGRAEIIHNILIAVDIRPLSISILADLTKLLILQEDDLKKTIIKTVFQNFHDTFDNAFKKSIEMKFLRRCMDKGIFEFNEIKNEMDNFSKNYPNSTYFHLVFFVWFAPEMDSQMFNFYNSLMSEQLIQKNCPRFLTHFNNSFPYLRKNDWKLFKEKVKYGHFMETAPYCIKYDKVETLSKLASEFDFNINQFIVPSLYEPSILLRENITLIELAAYYGSVRCFKFLMLNNADTEIKSDSGWTLAQYAIAGGNLEIIRICEQRQLDFSKTYHFAALFNQNKVFDWMNLTMSYPIDEVDKYLGTPLHQAVIGENIGLIYNLIVKYGIDINIVDSHKRTPLHYAVMNGCTNSIKFLLSSLSIDPNAKDENQNSPLHLAVKYSKWKDIDALLQNQNININEKGKNGVTPLHILAFNDKFDILPNFIHIPNLDLNPRDNKGSTPLHYAVHNDNDRSAAILCLSHRVKINAADNNGLTPLHIAAIHGNIKIMNILLHADGIDVNAESNDKNTPLHCAVSKEFRDPNIIVRTQIIDLLLREKNIDRLIKNKNGYTPIELAQHNNLIEAVSHIQSYSQ